MSLPTDGEFREAALNIPEELGVELDQPLPNDPPGGASGRVFYGSLLSGRRRVAVKIQRAGDMSNHESNVLLHLHNLARPHTPPMLPELYGEKAHNGWHYLVMDGDAKGNGWSEWFDSIHSVGAIDADSERTLAERFVQAAVAILFMHAAGHAHHDIKLDNTMLVDAGSSFPWGVCVIDFGMACPLAPGEYKHRQAGTPAFLAPEALAAWRLGLPADLWSLGITLFTAAAGFQPFRQAFAAEDIAGKNYYTKKDDFGRGCFTKVQQAQQLNGQSSSTATIFHHWNQNYSRISASCPFSAELTALVDAMLTIDPANRPSITGTLELALAWSRAVLGPAGTNAPPPWLRAAAAALAAAAEAPFNPAAIAEAVASHAPGSSAQHAAAASAEPAAAAPALGSMSVSSESTPTPSLTPSLEEMNAEYEAAMDEAATISSRSTSGGTVWLSAVSMDEAGTGEGEAEPQMCSCSSSDGASQPAFRPLSADEPSQPAFRSLSAGGEPAPKRPRSAAVPLLPPRPVRQNAFVLPRMPL